MKQNRTPSERAKLDLAHRGVNFVLCATAMALLGLTGACTRPVLPMPADVAPGASPTIMGTDSRALGANENAPLEVEVAWRAEVGRGLQSPLLVNGPIVASAATNRIVAMVSSESGELFWERRLKGPASGGLLWQEDRLYAAAEEHDGEVYAMNVRNGRKAWERQIGSARQPPVLHGGALFVATDDGWVYSLGSERGAVHWRTRVRGTPSAPPIAIGANLLVPTNRDTLFALSLSNGEIVQRRRLPATVSAPLALAGSTLLLATHDSGLVAMSAADLSTLWRAHVDTPILAAPIVAPDGNIYVLDTHAQVWRVQRSDGAAERIAQLTGAARGSFSLWRDGFVVGRLDGMLFLLRRDGTIIWQVDLKDAIVAPATVSNGAVYVPLMRGQIVKLR